MPKKGYIFTQEHRKNISLATRGRKSSKQHILSMSIALKKAGVGKWNKGAVRSAETRKKISIGLKGKYTGNQRPNWKGGVSRDKHSNVLYKTWTRLVYERDSFTCQECKVLGGKLNAHHIKYWSKFPELRYELSNGITLCEKCHRSLHKRERQEILTKIKL